ncbi:MAG: hypothetical protein JXP34_11290, partial [Planctomycetes bacterium]|nr:hypothetical protein [Planctomycetota bacterium]
MRVRAAILCASSLALGPMAPAAEEYEIGGPLAGVKLPLRRTEFGEPAGFPGSLPEKTTAAGAVRDGQIEYASWGPQGQAPELELYPGSVEHYRAYMFKYMPIRSFFDRQSQIRIRVAPDIPGATPAQIESYRAPLFWVPRHEPPVDTGERLAPVPVVRCKVGEPVFHLDLGRLEPGLFAVRVIAAVEPARVRPFRAPVFLRMRVNDRPGGGSSAYRVRIGYCEEFYSVAEIYFHAPEARAYAADLSVGEGSEVDLLVHAISLDDALAGTVRRPIKARRVFGGGEGDGEGRGGDGRLSAYLREMEPPMAPEERLARDGAIWDAFPPLNAQGLETGAGGVKGVTVLDAWPGDPASGGWEHVAPFHAYGHLFRDPARYGVLLENEALGARYTVDDLRARRPLPGSAPRRDDGAGLFRADPANPAAGDVYAPIARAISERFRGYLGIAQAGAAAYRRTGDERFARDGALALVRYAYGYPAIDTANFIINVVHEAGPYGRDYRCRRRETVAFWLPHYAEYVRPVYVYDDLFEYIRSSRGLADAVGRFVPWVESPADVVRLVDVYLIQTLAKRILRYHYHTDPLEIAKVAAVLGDRSVTDPWMEWLFSRTFIYPLPPAGIQDAMITGCVREGTEYVASTYYAQGEGAKRVASVLDDILKFGGDPAWSLSDPSRYPKPLAHCAWQFDTIVAGGDFIRIGDVCGPDKRPGHTFGELTAAARDGWRWSRDPRFAFVLEHFDGAGGDEIEAAAAKMPRAPWLAARSRVLPNWAGILETGEMHDDYRFHRAAYLRIGFGVGHHHHDALDLQVVAHGMPATIDGGQRPGYSSPGDRSSIVHNIVLVDGAENWAHSWARAMADADGARYLEAEMVPPGAAKLYRRQIALIDVDEGEGSRPLPPADQRPGAKLPRGVRTATSYVFDVVRVAGGKEHAYLFHAGVNDGFDWNVAEEAPASKDPSLAPFRIDETKYGGTAPEALVATWRQRRTRQPNVVGGGSEEFLLGENFDPEAPRAYTRLHLLGVAGARALRADALCKKWSYRYTCTMTRTAGEDLESAFAAIIEPYRGIPSIGSARRLEIEGNEADALRAVAVEVKTENGRTDICFAGGRPDRVRAAASLRVAGGFAYHSTDAGGFRQCVLAGGTLLEGPNVRLTLRERDRTGTIVEVDYPKRTFTIDARWPAQEGHSILEMGLPGRMTTYTATRIRPQGDRTSITVRGGADYLRAPIEAIDASERTVKTALGPAVGLQPGVDKRWVASD